MDDSNVQIILVRFRQGFETRFQRIENACAFRGFLPLLRLSRAFFVWERSDQAMQGENRNRLEAVQKVEARQNGYDIVFMDITMPILDGFGATRQIRAIEDTRRRRTLETEKSMVTAIQSSETQSSNSNSALIIAFTGRSSIEDQTEAVRVGIDLFMTKPVAFKEVGKIIDNWVANRERGEGE